MLRDILLSSPNLGVFGAPLLFLLAVFGAIFLFWRAARYEYIDQKFLFDILAVCAVGAFVFSRLFDFIFNFHAYEWSLAKLVFFNSFGGFDIWGGLLGAILSAYLFLRRKKAMLLDIFDLSAAPIVFGLFVYSFANLSRGIYDAFFYFALFVVIKRLEQKKRRRGFFACFALISVSVLNLVFYGSRSPFDYQLVKPIGFLLAGLGFWYLFSKRNIKWDFKGMVGWFLLGGFGFRRILSNIQEADKLAKNIILSPYYFGRGLLLFVTLLVREIYASILGFMQALGVRR